ncbi:MAG TPA: hypothetical protein VGB77_20845 [Abditibacteriaceae bacterium]
MPDKTNAPALPAVIEKPRLKPRPQWEGAEKRFLVLSLLLIALFCSSLAWWGRLNELPTYHIPTPAPPSPNAYDTHVQATFLMAPVLKPAVDAILDNEKIEGLQERAKRYSLRRKEAWLRQNAGALNMMRQGLKQPYQQPALRSWSALLPYLSRFRELARRLVVESKAHALRGDYDAAAHSALDAVHFGHQIPRGGPSITGMVGQAIQNIGRNQLLDVLPHLSAPECKQAARRLEQIRALNVPYADILREEKWGGQASYIEIMKKPDWATQFSAVTGNAPDFWQAWRFRLAGKRRVLENYTNYMDKSIAEARKPYSKAREVPLPDDPVSQVMTPIFSNGRFTFARSETGSALALVALALRAYRLEKGAYPTSLSALVPNYLKVIPLDGFGSSETLRYQKQGAGYKLWSIGPDKQDNKGAPLRQAAKGSYYDDDAAASPRYFDAQGDWVLQF